ncbi:hypothetical protein [Streptomyces sp. NPDC056194]|uniref:hypothetical protein n=1 Tax=Streptomyces sp. NPDC056194 TaxID=3345744 RepID=UPI0035D8B9E0
MNEVVWTAISAVATALAFFAVAWQSVLTRRALAVSQTVALDAARARLDSGAPQVTVRLEEPAWPLLALSQHGMPVNAWPAGHSWHFPQGELDHSVLQAEVVVENHSGRPVEARFDGDLIIENADGRPAPAPTSLLVPAQGPSGGHGEVRVYLQKAFSSKALAGNHAAREAGTDLPHGVYGTVTVHDDRDNGVVDTWRVALTGCPIQPDPNRGSVWIVAPDHIDGRSGRRSLIYDLLPPRERTYWTSRRTHTPLHETGQNSR